MPSDSISIKQSFTEGIGWVLGPRGVLAAGLFLLWGLFNLPVQQRLSYFVTSKLFTSFLPGQAVQEVQTELRESLPFAFWGPLPAVLAGAFVLLIAYPVVEAVIVRLYASESGEPIPIDDVLDGLGGAVFKAAILGGALGLVTAIPYVGSAIGLVTIFAFVFLIPAAALEDLGLADTVRRNFGVMRASLAEVMVVTAIVFAAGVAVSLVIAGTNFVLQTYVFPNGELVGVSINVVTGLVGVFAVTAIKTVWLGVITSAYKQAREIADFDPEDFSDLEDEDWSSAGDEATGTSTSEWDEDADDTRSQAPDGDASEQSRSDAGDAETDASEDVGFDDEYDPFSDEN